MVAASDVRFRQLEVGRGIMPFGGATFRAQSSLGWGNAMRFLLTGEEFGADEALRIGLVQEVVAPGEQLAEAIRIAELIAAQAPLGVQATLANSRVARDEGPAAAVEHLRGAAARASWPARTPPRACAPSSSVARRSSRGADRGLTAGAGRTGRRSASVGRIAAAVPRRVGTVTSTERPIVAEAPGVRITASARGAHLMSWTTHGVDRLWMSPLSRLRAGRGPAWRCARAVPPVRHLRRPAQAWIRPDRRLAAGARRRAAGPGHPVLPAHGLRRRRAPCGRTPSAPGWTSPRPPTDLTMT